MPTTCAIWKNCGVRRQPFPCRRKAGCKSLARRCCWLNGEKDPWISIRDLYLLLENGEPKCARTYPEGGHMGGDPNADKLVANWLKSHLLRT